MEENVEQTEQEIRGVAESVVGKPVAALSPAFQSRLQALIDLWEADVAVVAIRLWAEHSREYLRGVKDPFVRWFMMDEGWQHHWLTRATARIKQGLEGGR